VAAPGAAASEQHEHGSRVVIAARALAADPGRAPELAGRENGGARQQALLRQGRQQTG